MKPSLVGNSFEKIRLLEPWKNARGNATAEIDTAPRQNGDGHIADGCAKYSDEHVQGGCTDFGLLLHTRLNNDRCPVLHLFKFRVQPARLLVAAAVPQKLINIGQMAAGADALEADMAIAWLQVIQQVDFLGRAGCKRGVAAFAGQSLVSGPGPDQKSGPETSSGSHNGYISQGLGNSGVQSTQFLTAEVRNGRGDGLQVIDQRYPSNIEALRNRPSAYPPGQIGDLRCLIVDRTGNAETGNGRDQPHLVQKLVDDRL